MSTIESTAKRRKLPPSFTGAGRERDENDTAGTFNGGFCGMGVYEDDGNDDDDETTAASTGSTEQLQQEQQQEERRHGGTRTLDKLYNDDDDGRCNKAGNATGMEPSIYDDEDDDGEVFVAERQEQEDDDDDEGEDPFPYLLKPQPIPPWPPIDGTSGKQEAAPTVVLWWHGASPHLSKSVEERMTNECNKLLHWGKKERGMMKDQPKFRLEQVKKLCRRERVPLSLALSLRRHVMKNLNPYSRMSGLKLGRDEDIRESAEIFERCVEEYLRRSTSTSTSPLMKNGFSCGGSNGSNDGKSCVEFWTEREQREHNKPYLRASATPTRQPPSPDFVLKFPIRMKRFYYRHGSVKNTNDRRHSKQQHRHQKQHRNKCGNHNDPRDHDNEDVVITDEQDVCWIEAKMFYGASTIPQDNNSAVGCLLATAKKYVRTYGPGAMIFMHGCGDDLARWLSEVGVLALDCGSRDTIDLRPVLAHQRTWCANSNGQILP